MERSRGDLTNDLSRHIAGTLRDPKTSGLLFELERYSAKTQISILLIPVVADLAEHKSIGWLMVKICSACPGDFAIWATVASIEVCLYRMEKTYRLPSIALTGDRIHHSSKSIHLCYQ